jgi:hypothetical protein
MEFFQAGLYFLWVFIVIRLLYSGYSRICECRRNNACCKTKVVCCKKVEDCCEQETEDCCETPEDCCDDKEVK